MRDGERELCLQMGLESFSHLSYLCKLVFWPSKTVCLTKNIKLFGATLDKASGI